MDLTIQVENTKLNIRVAVLAETKNGFIFEKRDVVDYYFLLGGRVKINEDSLETAKREVLEEIGYEIKDMELVSVVENFYDESAGPVHEICFFYRSSEILDFALPEGFIELDLTQIDSLDVRPKIIKEIVKQPKGIVSHHINRG